MGRSSKTFSRWVAHERTSWSFQVFLKHNQELSSLSTAHLAARKFTYASLGRQGSNWTDNPAAALGNTDKYLSMFEDLKAWSEAYELFENWMNLSAVLTVAANLETYLASTVALALQSDPGILIGSPRSLDGARLLKHKPRTALDIDPHIEACTRGNWSSRLSSLERLFGPLSPAITAHHSELERLRNIRNRFGHAFGREIAEARKHGVRAIKPMERLSQTHANNLKKHATIFARELDRQLLSNHIGDYEALGFYAEHASEFPPGTLGERANALKKAIGGIGAVPRGKTYCRGLLEHWAAL